MLPTEIHIRRKRNNSTSTQLLLPLIFITLGCMSTLSIVTAVKITNFNVPSFPPLKSTVFLECDFSKILSPEEQLYSVKWYREDWKDSKWKEFYSWKPKKRPHDTKLDGIKVDMHRSSMKRVVLRKVILKTSGTFRCEVTTRSTARNSKRFDSPTMEGKLVVVELPKEPPIITGGLKSYQLGDRLELNCTSPRTFPATTLQWVLNGNKITGSTPVKSEGRKNGLIRTMISLNKTISNHDFRNKELLKIECVSGIEVLQGKHPRGRNTYEIEYLNMPAEYLKQQISWKEINLVNGGRETQGMCYHLGIFVSLILIITNYYISNLGVQDSFVLT